MHYRLRFTPEVEQNLLFFLRSHRYYTQNYVNQAINPNNVKHYDRLRRYLHNIILRRAGLDSNVHCFGSRIIGTSTPTSDLDIFVKIGEVILI